MRLENFKGKVAVVTGAASGIGLAAATRFVAEGMKVVLADVAVEALDAETTRLQDKGADVLGVRCDVCNFDDVRELADRTIAHFEAVHLVFNNAGIAPVGALLEATSEEWRRAVETNLLGIAHGVMVFGPMLKSQGEGSIINTASEAGHVSTAVTGMYSATKHAVVGLTEALYRELESSGVSVHCLCPGLVDTQVFSSERMHDDEVKMSPEQIATAASLQQAVEKFGMPPAQVVDKMVAAIRRGRFWIFTHETTLQAYSARYWDIELERNPTDPHAGIPDIQQALKPGNSPVAPSQAASPGVHRQTCIE